MAFQIGLKAIRRLCEQQNSLEWFKAKLSASLFKPSEVPVFEWVDAHVRKHHALPHPETLLKKFPELVGSDVPEPASYYVELLENSYYHAQITQASFKATEILKNNKDDWESAAKEMRQALNRIKGQEYRTKILDFGKEASGLLMQQYHSVGEVPVSGFGWPYMDDMGGAMAGDVISFIGRPQMGKSWMSLYVALHNWQKVKHNVLFVSMEMNFIPIAQRAAAMIAGTNLTQLKKGQYSNFGPNNPYDKFVASLAKIEQADHDGAPKLYIVNGNLATDCEEIYILADQLGCKDVVIDGAYLCRNKNARLDRFTRAAENCETMKRCSEDLGIPTFSSWQFNREAAKKQKSKGGAANVVDMEDIGYTDAVPQISSIVLGLFQEDGVETIKRKKVRVMKGRGGETGEFEINWDFDSTNFDQVGADGLTEAEEHDPDFEAEAI